MSESKQIPEWLRKAWKHYSRAGTFDVDMAQWLRDYPNLREVMDKPSEYFEALAMPGTTLPDGVTPALVTVRIEPKILEALKAEPRENPGRKVSRQESVIDDEGVRHKIDLRNLRNYELLSPETRPEDLETVARSYLWNMMHSKVKRVARGSQRELQHLILLRGKDLPADLCQLAKLRLTGFTGTYEGELPENGVSKGEPWRATINYEPFD